VFSRRSIVSEITFISFAPKSEYSGVFVKLM
jgi:hypothetical protein